MKYLIYPVLLFLLMTSCNVSPEEKAVPAWETEILGPLVKTGLEIQDIIQLDDIGASQSISLSDLGIPAPGFPVIIPASPSVDLGPFDLDMTDAFSQIETASGEMYFTIRNNLEINVNPGTRIVISQNGTPLIDNTLTNGIPANGGSYTMNPRLNLTNQIIHADMSLEVLNFSSNGSNGEFVAINPSNRLIIDIYVRNVKLKSITLGSANTFELADTSDFTLSGDLISAESVSGVFNTFITNGMPIDLRLQTYFLDQSQTIVLDSLFDSPSLIPANTGTPQEIKLVTNINESKIRNLNNAWYSRVYLRASTGANVVIHMTDRVEVQIVGDLKLKINKN